MTSLTTRRLALSRAERLSTAVAAVVSSTAYVTHGNRCLARGVVGDLTGFLVLGTAGAAAGGRLRHEAAACLVLIRGVLVLDPAWPDRIDERRWWAAFATGSTAYVLVRGRLCD